MSTITAAAGGGNWTAGATWVGGVAPTAADDALLTGTSGNVTIDLGAVCRSLNCTGYTGVLTHNAITFNIGDATAGLTSVALLLVSGMTYTLVNATTSAITFKSTSATQQTIATGGKTLGNVVINGAGSSYQLSDNLTSSGSFTYTAGTTFDTTTGSRIITLNGVNSQFTGGSKTYFELDLTGSGNPNIVGTNTFTNFNRTGTAVKTDTLIFTNIQTVTGNFTLAGNSATNRLLVQSNVLGTSKTITNTGATQIWSNVDLRDIQLGTSFNASAITGLSGDCGGNGNNITFTTAATQTATGTASFTWSTHGWTSRVPLPQDDVVINNAFVAGRTVTLDMPRAGKSIDWTGATGTPAWAVTTATTVYGSITKIAGMTQSGTTSVTFEGRGAFTFTNAGVSWTNPLTVAMVGGTLTLQDALSSTSTFTHNNGTFVDGGFATTFTTFTSNSGLTRVLTRTGNMTVNGTGAVHTITSTGLTYTGTGSTTTISETTQGTSKTFAGGGLTTYGNITFSGKNIIVTGANTFAVMALNNLGDTTGVTLPASTTTTVTGFTSTASSGNVAKLISSTSGTAATLSKASGTVSVDYVSIKDSAATGGAAWYAGANSTDVSGNTGWIFTAPPLLQVPRRMLSGVGA